MCIRDSLSQELLENHVRVRIVERDPARCNVLAESLPEAQILNEDGSKDVYKRQAVRPVSAGGG